MQRKILLSIAFLGVALTATLEARRIVTLGGAATEIVFALGAGEDVVGRDQSSLYPPRVRELPEAGYVRAISAEGVLALEPDIVIATSDIGPDLARRQIQAAGCELVVVEAPDSPASLKAAVRQIGRALGRSEAAAELVAGLEAQYGRLDDLPHKPRVVLFMHTPGGGSIMAAGQRTKAAAMIELAGGVNAVTSHAGYKPLSREGLLELNPDVILVAAAELPGSEPVEADKLIRETPGWGSLPAVRSGHVHTVPLGRTLGFGPRSARAALQLNQYFAQALRTN